MRIIPNGRKSACKGDLLETVTYLSLTASARKRRSENRVTRRWYSRRGDAIRGKAGTPRGPSFEGMSLPPTRVSVKFLI